MEAGWRCCLTVYPNQTIAGKQTAPASLAPAVCLAPPRVEMQLQSSTCAAAASTPGAPAATCSNGSRGSFFFSSSSASSSSTTTKSGSQSWSRHASSCSFTPLWAQSRLCAAWRKELLVEAVTQKVPPLCVKVSGKFWVNLRAMCENCHVRRCKWLMADYCQPGIKFALSGIAHCPFWSCKVLHEIKSHDE